MENQDTLQLKTNSETMTINFEALRKLKDPTPFYMDQTTESGMKLLTAGTKSKLGRINNKSRTELLEDGASFGDLEYSSQDGTQKTIDFMLETQPSHLSTHLNNQLKLAQLQMTRMEDLLAYCRDKTTK